MVPSLQSLGHVTLTQLAYAVAVDTYHHFGRAAEACHVTQPTLSMQLSKLERALDVILFDRSRSPVVATDVGKLVLAQARIALREAARISDIRDAASGVVAGELRIGVIPTLAPSLLPRIVPALTRRFPRLELVIEEWKTAEIVAGLKLDTLDAGIVASNIEATGIDDRPLFTEPFLGYVSAGHRLANQSFITLSDLSLDDLWLLSEGHCFRAQTIALCEQRADKTQRSSEACTLGARFESGNLETLTRLVERGLGMTLLPTLAAIDLPTKDQQNLIRPFTHPAPSRLVRLIRQRVHLKDHLVEAFVSTLIDCLPSEIVQPNS